MAIRSITPTPPLRARGTTHSYLDSDKGWSFEIEPPWIVVRHRDEPGTEWLVPVSNASVEREVGPAALYPSEVATVALPKTEVEEFKKATGADAYVFRAGDFKGRTMDGGVFSSPDVALICSTCGKSCASKAGLAAHERTHRKGES